MRFISISRHELRSVSDPVVKKKTTELQPLSLVFCQTGLPDSLSDVFGRESVHPNGEYDELNSL